MRELNNTAELSEHVHATLEAPTLLALRRESHAACASMRQAVGQLEGFLKVGGPAAVMSLRSTIKKLQTELEQEKGLAQVQRYRALQQDLKQRDVVCDALRGLLNSQCNMGDAAVDEWLNKKVLKLECLYGASREHLLRENKALRSALESRLITTKTSLPTPNQDAMQRQPGGLTTNGTKDSRTPIEGAHQLAALMHAAERLSAAEKRHRPPAVRSASTQADDGSHSTICTLESHVHLLASQKAQLMQKVSEVQSALGLCECRAEAAESEAAEARRQKTDIMFHQGDMSAEIRRHLASETARADKAEVSAAEARHDMQVARENASAARAEASILQTVLVDKDTQVQRLTEQQESMKEALLAAMDGLASAQAQQQASAGSVADEVKAANRATEQQLSGAIALLQDVCKAAADSTSQASSLAAQQRELVDKFGGEREVALKAMATLEAQLTHAQGMAHRTDRERQQLQHQIIASSLLGRHQDRRHDEALQALRRAQAQATPTKISAAEQHAASTYARALRLSQQGSQPGSGQQGASKFSQQFSKQSASQQPALEEVAAAVAAAAAARGGVPGPGGGVWGDGSGLCLNPGAGAVGGRAAGLRMGGLAGQRGLTSGASQQQHVSGGAGTQAARVGGGGGASAQAPRVSGSQVEAALEPNLCGVQAGWGGGGAHGRSSVGGCQPHALHEALEDASAAVLQRSAALRVALEVLASSPSSVPP